MKYALVTGASRGIGKAVSFALVEMGYCILLNYRSNTEQATATRNEIIKKGGHAVLCPFDVCDGNASQLTISTWIEENPNDTIEVLVNNAGVREDSLLMWMTESQWKNVIQTSLDSFYYVTKPIVTEMLKKRYGRIINIVSQSGISGMPGQTNYSSAKAGLIGATKALAQEVAKRGVTVNAVAPGFIKTDMTKELNEMEMKGLIPMQKFGEADDVASAVAFLASSKASYITGIVLPVNGGLFS